MNFKIYFMDTHPDQAEISGSGSAALFQLHLRCLDESAGKPFGAIECKIIECNIKVADPDSICEKKLDSDPCFWVCSGNPTPNCL